MMPVSKRSTYGRSERRDDNLADAPQSATAAHRQASGASRCCLYPSAVVNFLTTLIAMVEAGEGIAVIPSFGLPACQNRKVVISRLIDPVVSLEFYQISNRGKKLPPGADDFTFFLQSYIARWAGRAGVL